MKEIKPDLSLLKELVAAFETSLDTAYAVKEDADLNADSEMQAYNQFVKAISEATGIVRRISKESELLIKDLDGIVETSHPSAKKYAELMNSMTNSLMPKTKLTHN